MRIPSQMRHIPLIVLTALLVVLLPAAASAQRTNVPPGNAEADQYAESVPDGKGGSTLDRSRDPADVLGDDELAALEQLGAAGVEAAGLAAASAPEEFEGGSRVAGRSGKGSGSAGGGEGSDPAGGEASGEADQSPPTAATEAAGTVGDDGMGSLLWVILAASALAGFAYLFLRRRRPGGA